MKAFDYLQYFYFLCTNWNIKIATHIITQEIKNEKKYGINSTGADDLQALEEKGVEIENATLYMPASYDLLEKIFAQLDWKKIPHFIDIGCGKGRALCVAAHFGATKLTGVDFSRDFCEQARKNLAITQQKFPQMTARVLHNDAFYFDIPDDCNCIFMFNPFDDVIMSGVVENIEISLERRPRPIQILYVNPMQKHLFLEAGYSQTWHFQQMVYLEAVILKKEPV
jgi:SAM-dependent methyltransferase